MARVKCDVDYVDVEEGGRTLLGVRVTCQECDAQAECFGETSRSVKRALMILKENCEEVDSDGPSNFYVAAGGEDED